MNRLRFVEFQSCFTCSKSSIYDLPNAPIIFVVVENFPISLTSSQPLFFKSKKVVAVIDFLSS